MASDTFALSYEDDRRRRDRADREELLDAVFAQQAQREEAQQVNEAPAPQGTPSGSPAGGPETLATPERLSESTLYGALRGPFRGTANAIDNAVEIVGNIAAPGGGAPAGAREALEGATPEPEGLGPQMAQGITQQAVGFIPAFRALKAMGWASTFGRGIVADIAATPATLAKEDENLARMAVELGPEWLEVLEFAASSPDDSALEAFGKNALEAAAVGVPLAFALEKGLPTLARTLSRSRRVLNAAEVADDISSESAREVSEVVERHAAARAELSEGREALERLREAAANAVDESDIRIATRPDGLDSAATARIPAVGRRLRAAVRLGQDVTEAPQEGGMHNDAFEALAERMGVAPDEIADDVVENLESGFLDNETGQFLTRQEAVEVMNELTPERLSIAQRRAAMDAEEAAEAAVEEATKKFTQSADELDALLDRDTLDPRLAEQARIALDETVPSNVPESKARVDAIRAKQAAREAELAALDVPSGGPPPQRLVIEGGIEFTTEEAAALRSTLAEGDFETASDFLAPVFDSTNFERIAEQGGVQDTIAHVAKLIGPGRTQADQTVQTLAETATEAGRILREDLRAVASGDIDRLTARLDALVPGTQDLAAKVTALRTFEMGLAKRVQALADPAAITNSDAQAAEFLRWATLLANVNDTRRATSTEIGRALSAHRIGSKSRGFDKMLADIDAGGELTTQIRRVVAAGGGTKKIAQLAADVRERGVGLREIRKSLEHVDTTTGLIREVLYENFVTGILSGWSTHAVNLVGNAAAAMWMTSDLALAQSFRAIRDRNPAEFRVVMDHIQGMMYGAKVGLIGASQADGSLARTVARNPRALRSGTIAEAWRRSDTVTVNNATQFAQDTGLQPAISSQRFLAHAGRSDAGRVGQFVEKTLRARNGFGARVVDAVGHLGRWPFRALAAGDELAKSVHFYGSTNVAALKSARELGLEGAEAIAHQSQILDDITSIERLFHAARESGDEEALDYVKRLARIRHEAVGQARMGTFTKEPGPVTDGIMRLRQRIPLFKFAAPFVQTPANLLAFATIDRGPIFFATKAFRDDFMAGGLRREEAIARHATGTMITAVAGMLAFKGVLTGSGPSDPKARANWMAQGNVPYSFKVPWDNEAGFRNISFNRMDPVAIVAGTMADLVALSQTEDETTIHELGAEALFSVMEALSDKSYVQGVADFFRFITEPRRYGNNFLLKQSFAILTPQSSFLRNLRKAGVVPDPESFEEAFGERVDDGSPATRLRDIAFGDRRRLQVDRTKSLLVQMVDNARNQLPPGPSDALVAIANKMGSKLAEQQPMLNIWGEEVNIPLSIGPDIMSPFMGQDPEADPIRNEFHRLGAGPDMRSSFGRLTENGKNIVLSPEQMNVWIKASAAPKSRRSTFREAIERTMSTLQWERMTDDDRLQKLEAIRGAYRRSGKKELFERFPELKAEFDAHRDEKRAARRAARQENLLDSFRQR